MMPKQRNSRLAVRIDPYAGGYRVVLTLSRRNLHLKPVAWFLDEHEAEMLARKIAERIGEKTGAHREHGKKKAYLLAHGTAAKMKRGLASVAMGDVTTWDE